jgi:hypothetical protein
MKTMKIHFTISSGNKKTGLIPVSTSGSETCPSACPLKMKGCYAKSGPLGIHWSRLNSDAYVGLNWHEFCAKISALPRGQLWRHNQAGDLPGNDNQIDADLLAQLVAANRGRRGFTYTHKPMTATNQFLVRSANREGFTVNLSADNLNEADELKNLGVGPVVVVLPSDAPNTVATPKGHKVIVCPAQQRDDVSCSTCQLCQKANRSVIVGFRAHGAAAKHVSSLVR